MQWQRDGPLEAFHYLLLLWSRTVHGRSRQPTAPILDYQSVKTTEKGGRPREDDAGKKVNGRKRHLLVDVLGFVLCGGASGQHSGPRRCALITAENRSAIAEAETACSRRGLRQTAGTVGPIGVVGAALAPAGRQAE